MRVRPEKNLREKAEKEEEIVVKAALKLLRGKKGLFGRGRQFCNVVSFFNSEK